MNPWIIVLIVIAVVLVLLIVLSIVGRKLQAKQNAAQATMMDGAQSYTIMVIDKKRMRLCDAGFPQIVLDQTPKWLRKRKVPVVKAKIGPKVASMICDDKVFDKIPTKKEVKALMNGIYIIDVKGLRSPLEVPQGKKGFFARLRSKAQKVVDEDSKSRQAKNADKNANTSSKKKK